MYNLTLQPSELAGQYELILPQRLELGTNSQIEHGTRTEEPSLLFIGLITISNLDKDSTTCVRMSPNNDGMYDEVLQGLQILLSPAVFEQLMDYFNHTAINKTEMTLSVTDEQWEYIKIIIEMCRQI